MPKTARAAAARPTTPVRYDARINNAKVRLEAARAAEKRGADAIRTASERLKRLRSTHKRTVDKRRAAADCLRLARDSQKIAKTRASALRARARLTSRATPSAKHTAPPPPPLAFLAAWPAFPSPSSLFDPVDTSDGGQDETCTVCLDPVEPLQHKAQLHCSHAFHSACVDPWVAKHNTCPVCRAVVIKSMY